MAGGFWPSSGFQTHHAFVSRTWLLRWYGPERFQALGLVQPAGRVDVSHSAFRTPPMFSTNKLSGSPRMREPAWLLNASKNQWAACLTPPPPPPPLRGQSPSGGFSLEPKQDQTAVARDVPVSKDNCLPLLSFPGGWCAAAGDKVFVGAGDLHI